MNQLSDVELAARMSKKLQWLERAYLEAAERMDARAGDDREGSEAEMALRFKGIYYGLKKLHCEASILGCMANVGMPMARGGER